LKIAGALYILCLLRSKKKKLHFLRTSLIFGPLYVLAIGKSMLFSTYYYNSNHFVASFYGYVWNANDMYTYYTIFVEVEGSKTKSKLKESMLWPRPIIF